MLKLRYKIWLDNSGKAFGEGPCDMLKRIDRLGSLNKAAGELNMSYSKAWKLMNTMEKRLGFKLLKRDVGGDSGGGSYLTEEARVMIHKYTMFVQDSDKALNKLFKYYFEEE